MVQKRFKEKMRLFWKRIRPHLLLPLWQRWLQWSLIGIGGITTIGVGMILLSFIVFSFTLPDIDNAEDLLQAQSTVILDREGNLLYSVHGEENRKIVPIENISDYLIDATVAVEDDQFYNHWGFDLPCMFKAVAHEVLNVGIRRGCSTITQQLVKNIFLTPEQTYKRKIQELILAVALEFKFSKEEILELYLNEIPYGNNAYGAELAAQRYFNKSAEKLTLTEAAILAGLPKAPTRYSPYGSNKNSYLVVEFNQEQLDKRPIDSVENLSSEEYVRGLIGAHIQLINGNTLYIPGRVDIVLDAMGQNGMITEDQFDFARAEAWALEFKSYRDSIKAPHFVLYVRELLEEKYGKEIIEQGGLKIYTTLDPKMQEIAETTIEKYRERNLNQYGANNASLVSVQPQTGQILAMVGSADYFDETIDGNVNIATRKRQPGSSFKPFIYALSFLNGYAPATVIYDVRTQIAPGDWPNNYDGTFQGPMSIRQALGQSRNIPAAKAYFLAGMEEAIIPFMQKFGIELDSSIGYGWPLALGTGEVSLLDFSNAYAVFANGGTQKPLSPILKIENAAGEILEQWEDPTATEVLDPEVAYLINNILSDSSVSLGPRLSVPGQIVAAKTGTSNKKDSRGQNVPSNNWAMGYSTKLVTGVWVGNADGSGLGPRADGYNSAAPIWQDFMRQALTDIPSTEFSRPPGIVEVAVSKATGLLPSEHTTTVITEKFASFNVPTQIEDRMVTLKIDKKTDLIANEYSPEWSLEEKTYFIHKSISSEYPAWQTGIDAWVEASEGIEKPPTETDSLHTAETWANRPLILIISPSPYSQVDGGALKIKLNMDAENGVDRVEFYLGETLQYIETSSPYSGEVRIPINASPGEEYTIKVYIYDDLGYRSESSVVVQVASDSFKEEEIDEEASSEVIENILE